MGRTRGQGQKWCAFVRGQVLSQVSPQVTSFLKNTFLEDVQFLFIYLFIYFLISYFIYLIHIFIVILLNF